MTACGLILGYLESFIVLPVGVPGIRIGLANIATLLTLYICNPVYAAIVQFMRITLSAVLFANSMSFAYSLCGAVLSFLAMIILKRFGFSIYGVSAGGAVCHNLGQIVVAAFLAGSYHILYYLPILAISGTIFGLITGGVTGIVKGRLINLTGTESEGMK